MTPIALIRALTISFLRTERFKFALTLAGMALGVAVFFSIRTVNESAFRSFANSVELVRPPSTLSVVSAAGRVPESVVPLLRRNPLVHSALPFVSRVVRASRSGADGEVDLGTVQVVAVDTFAPRAEQSVLQGEIEVSRGDFLSLLSQKPSALASVALFDSRGEPIDLIVNGRAHRLELVASLPQSPLTAAYGGKLIVIDIATFEALFGEYGSLDRVDVSIRADAPADAAATIAASLPSGMSLESASAEVGRADRMTEAFRLNLNFLGAIALFAGMLLIYNTAGYFFLKRRRDLSTLLSLGASPRLLFRFLLVEATALGICAGTIGVAVGQLLAHRSLGLVSGTMSALYVPVLESTLRTTPALVIESLALAVALSLIGSAIPAAEVLLLPARATSSYQTFERKFAAAVPWFTVCGIIFLAVALVFAREEMLTEDVRLGFVAPTALVLGFVMLTPVAILAMLRGTGRIMRWAAGHDT
ncbi:MAG: ABC transporter permease, partial [Deltaproteobacteria bacterium]|nr:ABC transporter permease [Deltaproteobacteria bacterium]